MPDTITLAGVRLTLDNGRIILPALAGAEEPVEPDPVPEPDPTPDPEPEPTPEPDPDPEPFDRERAMRTIQKQRQAEKAARERAEKAEARAKELEDAQLSEQEKVVKDRDEARAQALREKDRADRLTIDGALRDAALDGGVDPKRIRRALKLIDRDDLTIDIDGEVSGASDAVETFLGEFPEFKLAEKPGDEPIKPDPEPPGGAPDRKRKRGEMTPEQSRNLAETDPVEWNRLFDEGLIPASALR